MSLARQNRRTKKHIKNQTSDAALFQDLGNSPASFEASRWAVFLGCLDGWDVQMADAVQAYIQATLRGTPCWIELPAEAVPEDDKGRWNQFKRPVVRLVVAVSRFDDRLIEVIANGLPLWNGAQLAVDTTIVSPLTAAGKARSRRDPARPVALLEATYPSSRCRLVVIGVEVGGRWGSEAASFLRLLARATPGPHEETKDHPSRAPIQTGPVERNRRGNRVPANGYETPSCQAGGTSEGASGAYSWTTRTPCSQRAHENIVWC